ncbi:MAG: hypothetical protein V3T21_00305 [Candidatus Margulisiibacteriota bacterium]
MSKWINVGKFKGSAWADSYANTINLDACFMVRFAKDWIELDGGVGGCCLRRKELEEFDRVEKEIKMAIGLDK